MNKVNKKFKLELKVVSNEEERLKAFVVRTLVYIAEQSCPYDEEFDLNDYAATQILGTVKGEPVVTARIRYFGEFAKLERLAVRKEYRGLGYGQQLLDFMLQLCIKKGYKKIYLHAQEGKEDFYCKNNFQKMGQGFTFSGFRYTEMFLSLKSNYAAGIGWETQPMILNRPEGAWENPGPLEKSVSNQPSYNQQARA